jgi:hypothetical protein
MHHQCILYDIVYGLIISSISLLLDTAVLALKNDNTSNTSATQ